MFRSLIVATAVLATQIPHLVCAQPKLTREQQVRKDKQEFAQNDAWIYDNLTLAINEAERSQRPMVIVFR